MTGPLGLQPGEVGYLPGLRVGLRTVRPVRQGAEEQPVAVGGGQLLRTDRLAVPGTGAPLVLRPLKTQSGQGGPDMPDALADDGRCAVLPADDADDGVGAGTQLRLRGGETGVEVRQDPLGAGLLVQRLGGRGECLPPVRVELRGHHRRRGGPRPVRGDGGPATGPPPHPGPGPGLLPAAWTGALLVSAADLVTQRVTGSALLPVGVVTGVAGGVYLAWLLREERGAGRL
jgi:hypothetical protein